MSTLKNGEFGIDLDKEKILWTDRKRHTIFSLPLSFTKYTLTETKLIIQRGCFNLREDEIQLYRVRDIAFKQNFYERLCRVGSIHLCSTDAMTPEIDIRRIRTRVMSRKCFLKPSRLAGKRTVFVLRKSSETMATSQSLTRMVCRLNLATNIPMTNTSPYRFSSVRAIFVTFRKIRPSRISG